MARVGPRATRGATPDVAYALVPGLPEKVAAGLAARAASAAAVAAPRLSGGSAKRIRPYWGEGFFGVSWADRRVWFQEHGTRGRVQRELAGRVIPMWVDDPTGETRRSDPKARTRVTADGRRQVLIFRRAARIGQRKKVIRRVHGVGQALDVPAAYPGAPGRIGRRGSGGRIAAGRLSGGVRWRHPGVVARGFVQAAVADAARVAGLGSPQVHVGRREG